MKNLLPQKQDGAILITIVIVFPFLILMASFFMSLAISNFRVAAKDQHHTHAQLAADSGIDVAVQEINTDNTWLGSGAEIEVHNDGTTRTTYETTVTAIDDDNKLLTSIGRSYSPVSSTTPEFDVTINVSLRAVRAGEYSVVSGVGGLYMQNSAKIVGGDVLINGEISMQNNSQIGLTSNPVTVDVAHQNCPQPPDATYPRLCASGENGEPINISDNAHIYGSIRANNQVSTASMSSPGLIASSGVTVEPLPPHNRPTQQANVTTVTSDAYYLDCDANNVTRTWPGRLKIEGDVSIKKGCQVTLEGDVWITGNLTIQNSARIVTADGIVLGGQNTINPDLPTVMVDGSAGVVVQNSGGLLSNASNVGMQVITYWSRAACSPDCTDVTGPDLDATRGDRTILLQNSAEAPNSIMYARWSQVELSNGGSIGAVVGQTVRLTNSATISFGVAAGTGNTYWVIDGYRRSYN